MALSSSFSTSDESFFESGDFRVLKSNGIVVEVLRVASFTRFGATFFRRDFGVAVCDGGTNEDDVADFDGFEIEVEEEVSQVTFEVEIFASLLLLFEIRERFAGGG
jgi:hypothetical protein